MLTKFMRTPAAAVLRNTAFRTFATVTRYSKEHEWVVYDDQTQVAEVGITLFAQTELGDLAYVEAPEVGEEIAHMDAVGTLESSKGVADLYTPISGEVTEVNESVVDDPALLSENTETIWIFKVSVSQPSEVDELMDREAYE